MKEKTSFKIVDFTVILGRFMAGVEMISGQIETNMVMISKRSKKKYRITGIGFIPAEEYKKGIRGISLKSENEKEIIENSIIEGEILIEDT